jgi:DNA modification methylase
MQTILTSSIICGDCKDKMRQYIPAESVDLIYLDPPFFSGKNYEIIWKDGAERRSFEDTKFYTLECKCGKVFPENHLFCPFCGSGKDKATERRSNDIEAYLQWLRPKLEECYRVLKSTGSIYVHLDWHAVHYVKVMMDEIFGAKNFRNDIVWESCGNMEKV